MTGRGSLRALVVLWLLLSTILGILVRPLPALAAAPQTPENQSPSDGATGISLTPILQASGFIDEDDDSHVASRWRIGGHEYESSSQLTSFQVESGVLEYSTEYTWQVSYCDNTSAWSEPSPLWSFTTMAEPQAPVVTTEAASGLGTTTATLNGSLVSAGTAASVTVYFEWGLTTGYGDTTMKESGIAGGGFSAELSGLAAGTTYHFQAIAVGDGTVYGGDRAFTTGVQAPVVTTAEASAVGTTSATLNGHLSDLGTAGSVGVSFRWGLTTGYGNTTTPASRASGGDFSTDLSGLSPNTTYHFQAVAAGDDTVYGGDRSFTTGVEPPVVATTAGSGINSTSATLNGNLSGLGTAGSVSVFFQWGLTTGYGNTTTPASRTSGGDFSAELSGLSPNTTYHFRAVAEGDGYNYGADRTFTTLALPDEPPAVTTREANAVGTTSATLNLNLTDLGSAASVEVYMEWGPTTAYGSTTARKAVSRTGASSFALSGLTPATTYHFRAVAVGDGTAYGSDLTFTTVAADPVPPVVTTVDAASIGTNSATLNLGLTAAGSAAAVQVSFEWGPTADYGQTTEAVAMSGPGSFSQPISGLAAATTYHFRAVATGDGTAYGGDLTFTTGSAPPVAPRVKTVDADAVTGASARLNGELSSLGTASSVTVSFVWGTSPGGPYPNETPGTALAQVGEFHVDLQGLALGTTYYLQARAVGDGISFGVEKSFATVGLAPRIDSLMAYKGQEGRSLMLKISGANLGQTTKVELGDGVRVRGLTVVSDTEIRVELAVDSSAKPGGRQLAVTTPSGTVYYGVPAGFLTGVPGDAAATSDSPRSSMWIYLVVIGVGLVLALLVVPLEVALWRRHRK